MSDKLLYLNQIAFLRKNIEKCYQGFFDHLAQRRNFITKIAELKSDNSVKQFGYSMYDPKREWNLFKTLNNQLYQLSIKEVLSLSLIIESQALEMNNNGEFSDDLKVYPVWSEGIHLKENTSSQGKLFFLINPLLLREYCLELFERVPLNENFISLKEDNPFATF